MRIAICTDAWHPQINGVVRSLSATVGKLLERGHEVELVTPDQFHTVPLPGYSEIRLAMVPRFGTRRPIRISLRIIRPAGSIPAKSAASRRCWNVF